MEIKLSMKSPYYHPEKKKKKFQNCAKTKVCSQRTEGILGESS